MFEFFDTFFAMIEMFIKKIFKNEKLFAMTTFAKIFEKNNIFIFERIDFNFNRMTYDFRINKFFIES